ncbi:MAG: TraR/DksA family transcriptional regulator [Rhodoferax sp.]|nr:TraR/DksA family transcriptional regulator [Rhodoferax sp.]
METYNAQLAPRFSQLLAQREAELRAILHAADNLANETAGAEQHEVVDFKDVATEQTLAMVEDMKAEHAAQELQNVLDARRRLHDQSYGFCTRCGEAIDLRRLAAMPAAPFCASCQAEHEHGQRSTMRR